MNPHLQEGSETVTFIKSSCFDQIGSDIMCCEIFPHFELEIIHKIFALVSKFWYSSVCLYPVEMFSLRGVKNILAFGSNSPRMMKVKSLELWEMNCEMAIQKLFRMDTFFSHRFSSLTSLSFHGSKIGDYSLKAITQSELLPNLTELDLFHNHITDWGMKFICEGKLQLKILKLNLNFVGDLGLEFLRDSEILKGNLREIHMVENEVTSQGLEILSEMTDSHLETLILVNNRIDSNIEKFCNSSLASQLKYLNLSNNHLNFIGAFFIQMGNFKSLENLTISRCQIPKEDIISLLNSISKSVILSNLTYLNFFGNETISIQELQEIGFPDISMGILNRKI